MADPMKMHVHTYDVTGKPAKRPFHLACFRDSMANSGWLLVFRQPLGAAEPMAAGFVRRRKTSINTSRAWSIFAAR